jgi:ribonuclease BN (tRNA processing enzyme)
MRLTVLGACGTYPVPDGACSGYLLQHDGFTVWVDAGSGTLAELQRHLPIEKVDAVFISHMHPDHWIDLYPFLYATSFHPEGPRRVPVYGPAVAEETFGRLISSDTKERFGPVFDWRGLAYGDQVSIGPFRVDVFESSHGMENLTMRAQADGKVLCYSGDTGPNEHLAHAAKESDLFLCEASWQDGNDPDFPPIHLRAGEAGAAAREAGTGLLVLTHIWPLYDKEVSMGQASETFGGTVQAALTGRMFEVGS